MTPVQFFLGETWIGSEFDALLHYWTNVFHGVIYGMGTITLVLGNNICGKLLPDILIGGRVIDVIKKDVCHGPDGDIDHALLSLKRGMIIGAMEIEPIQ